MPLVPGNNGGTDGSLCCVSRQHDKRAFSMNSISVLCTYASFRRTLWWACFALLSPFVMFSSSSEAEDMAPWRSSSELEQLWSGVLGCADADKDEEAVRNALANDSVPSGGVRRDYLDCGARALRAATSRVIVGTIEDSLRWGGSNLFDREFRLDSSLAWEIDGNARGDLDAVIPIRKAESPDGAGRAFFFQPGLALWSGEQDEFRTDGNAGLVYRDRVTPDLILGGSLFFDHNFRRGHSRLSVGVDAQSDNFYGGLNYYFAPFGKEWRKGRAGYEERALEGLGLHLSFAQDRLRLSGALGTWDFDGELDGRDSGWRYSAGVSAGYEIYSGVFLEAGYEHHDDRSLGADWNLGVAFRYSLPEMEGIGGAGGGLQAPDLLRIVDREKRIIYEERLAHDVPVVEFATESTAVVEGVDVDIPLKLNRPAPPDGLVLLAFSDKDDVIVVGGGMRISPGMQDGQYIRVTVNVDDFPEEYEMVRIVLAEPSEGLPEGWKIGRDEHTLMISPHGFNIAFEQPSSEVNEDAGTANLVLVLNRPAPAGLVLGVSSDSEEDAAPAGSTFTVPEGVERADLPVRVIDDELGEGDEVATIRIFDAEENSLPEGWEIGSPAAHELTIKDNDSDLGFHRSSSRVRESDLTTGIEIMVTGACTSADEINLTVTAEGNEDNDISFETLVPISAGEKVKTFIVKILQDHLPEDAERIVFTLSGELPESCEYGQRTHELTILPNENEAAFERASTSVREGDGTVNLTLELNHPAPEGLVLAFDSSSPEDAVPVSSTLRIPVGATSETLAVRIINDDIAERSEAVTISILGSSPTTLPEGWSIGSQDTHDLILTDDDLTVGFESSSSRVHESDLMTDLQIVLGEIGAPTGGISLSVSATGNEGNDVSFSSLLPISSGEDRKALRVMLTQDNSAEEDERIVLTLSGELPQPWEFGQRTHELTILSNEQKAMFAEAGKTVSEGDGSTSFKVVLSADAPAGGVPLEVAIASGNEGNDVTFATQSFTIAEGGREHTISVDINDDSEAESDETIVFTLSKRGGFPESWGDLGTQATFELVIQDDDQAVTGQVANTIEFVKIRSTVQEPRLALYPEQRTAPHVVNVRVTGDLPEPDDAFDIRITTSGVAQSPRDYDIVSPASLDSVSISSDTVGEDGLLPIEFSIKSDTLQYLEATSTETIILNIDAPSDDAKWQLGSNNSHKVTYYDHCGDIKFQYAQQDRIGGEYKKVRSIHDLKDRVGFDGDLGKRVTQEGFSSWFSESASRIYIGYEGSRPNCPPVRLKVTKTALNGVPLNVNDTSCACGVQYVGGSQWRRRLLLEVVTEHPRGGFVPPEPDERVRLNLVNADTNEVYDTVSWVIEAN